MAGIFQMEKQRQDMWCWAAVAVSVDHYFAPMSTSTQCQVARLVLELDECCTDPDPCNTPASLQVSLIKVEKWKETRPRPLRFTEIQREIDALRPVCVFIRWNGGGGHFVVINGYWLSAEGDEWVEVSDPLFPNSIVLYDVLVSAYQSAQDPLGGGQWSASCLVGV